MLFPSMNLSANVILISLLAVAMLRTLVKLSANVILISLLAIAMLRTLVKLSATERHTDFIISRSNLMLRTAVNLSARNALQFLLLQY